MPQQITLHPGMGEPILAHLEKLTPLPRFGVVAGQAVASAIDDLFGKGGGVYNDIDVFVPSTGTIVKAGDCVSPTAKRVEAQISAAKDYDGTVLRHLELVQTYRIEGVRYLGLVNKVYFRLPDRLVTRVADHSERIIAGFDINAVRVGIDLRTRRLVWDKHYEQFLRTRELRIAACYTPVHSFIRLMKKSLELSDVTVDPETAGRITAMLQVDEAFNALKTAGAVSVLFGDNFLRKAEAHRGSWLPYYSLDEQWFHKAKSYGGWRPGAGDESSFDAKLLHTMTPRGVLDRADVSYARELGELSVVALPEQVYRDRDRRTKTAISMDGIELYGEQRRYSKNAMPHHVAYYGGDYFEGFDEIACDDACYDELSEFVNKNRFSGHLLGASALQMLDFKASFETLQDSLVTNEGVLDIDNFMASLHVPAGVRDFISLKDVVHASLAAQRSPAHAEPLKLPSAADLGLDPVDDAHFEELSSLRELNNYTAQHSLICYERQPKGWRNRYIAVNLKDANGDRHFAVVLLELNVFDKMQPKAEVRQRSSLSGTDAERLLQQCADGFVAWFRMQGIIVDEPKPRVTPLI